MFSASNTNQATVAAGSIQLNVAATSNLRTSTEVVKSLAKGLIKASRGQAAISKYVNFKFGMGEKAGYAVSLWLSLRKLTSQMEMLEQLAIKANRPINRRDCESAALRSVDYLSRLLKNLKDVEKNHPSFRKELIEHLENMLRWCPQTPRVWAMAYKSLQPGEYVSYKNKRLDKNRCRIAAQHLISEIRRLRNTQRLAVTQVARV